MTSRLSKPRRKAASMRMAVLPAVLACVGLASALAHAASSDRLFTVAKLTADVTSTDAVAAKQEALQEAHQKALRTVFKRLAPFEAWPRLPRVGNETVESMLEGLSVRSEQNSRVRYIARLDFEFQPQAVRNLLRSHNIPFVEQQAEPVTVLPVYIANGRVDATGRDPWRKAWLSLDTDHALAPVKLARVLPSHTAEQVNQALSGDLNVFAALRDTAKAELLVIAVAEPADNGTRLSVRLYGADQVGPLSFGRTDRVYGTVDEANERAAALSLGILEGRWKIMRGSGATGAPGGSVAIQLVAEFSGLREWQDIRRRLSRLPGVHGLEVLSLSARVAQVTFTFTGPPEQLA
ncbi:MAG: DUF2066 domain-containing protein, partial [Hyphomicrobiales bacterium]